MLGSVDSFLIQVEVFLVLGTISHFQCVQDILSYHVMKLWLLFKSVLFADLCENHCSRGKRGTDFLPLGGGINLDSLLLVIRH